MSAAALTDVRLPTTQDTFEFGRRLAGILRRGDLIVLTGPLGAGKTVVVKGIGAGLNVVGTVVSPTFVIARVHRDGRIPLVHVDAYRLGSLAEVDDLDLDSASIDAADAVTVVEWGAGLVEQLADAHLAVTIDRAEDTEIRHATVAAHGGDWAERLRALG